MKNATINTRKDALNWVINATVVQLSDASLMNFVKYQIPYAMRREEKLEARAKKEALKTSGKTVKVDKTEKAVTVPAQKKGQKIELQNLQETNKRIKADRLAKKAKAAAKKIGTPKNDKVTKLAEDINGKALKAIKKNGNKKTVTA